MTDFEYREMLIENTRDTIAMGARYSELHADDRDEHEPIGECVFCGAEIYEDDAEYVFNDDEGTGICICCLNNCRWK